MRDAFFAEVRELAGRRDEVVVLTADLGFKLFDGIKQTCPERFYDVGVAESNMVGLAAGLSMTGKNVYAYSIIPFLVMRAYEQVRIDVDYQQLNVKLVGVGGGFTYGLEGITHFGLEDMALMRSLPNMTIVAPADRHEARAVARLSADHPGPMYIRLGRSGDADVHEREPDFVLGRAITMRQGSGTAIVATGSMVGTALEAAGILARDGIEPTVINMHTIKPLDTDAVLAAARTHEKIFTLEEHSVIGGLGSAVAETLAPLRHGATVRALGISGPMGERVGSAQYLRDAFGLSAHKVAQSIIEDMGE